MPLHGKIVVVKRSGADGTEFPLTAPCLFGRKPACDIRIQLPHVSKEHCRIDFNENKEVILTNLSSVNPTRVNGEALQQSERLKHGDVITIIDRSFRFESPPAPTPKKRRSSGVKHDSVKVLQGEAGEKRISEVSTDPHLKDGTNHDNIQRDVDKTVLLQESKEDDSLLQSKTASPFNDLYQMIKKSLDVKTPRKSSGSKFQTPSSKFCTPKPAVSTGGPAKTEDAAAVVEAQAVNGTPKSAKKPAPEVPAAQMDGSVVEADQAKSEAITPQKKQRATPQKSAGNEVVEQKLQSPKSPMRRRSKEATAEAAKPVRSSPRNHVKEPPTKRKSGEIPADLPKSQMKKKRVSFGVQLSPELFDKKLPPDSPLRKGAAPRRSLCLQSTKQSLLRRASVIGLLKEHPPTPEKSTSVQAASPKTPTPAKKTPKPRTPSPKAATPAKNSPKSKASSPKAQSPGKKTPKPKTPSPKAASPAKKSPGKKSPATPSRSSTPGRVLDTPTVQGRFSVSRISTPSPVAEEVINQEPSVAVTPKIPLKRKSMKSTARKSAVKAIVRRSGISRASLKASNSWADIVRFGQTKVQKAAPGPAKPAVKKLPKKATTCKPQTPARKPISHVSTGHADSPVTIVVGRAHKLKVQQPTGAAPRVVTNTVLSKKNMKMDEDLTGITEMFKTPANERKRRSVVNENSEVKTPMGRLSTSVAEPSVLKTPEESGEMIVSPLTAASTIKGRKYNSEAVQRLLDGDQESSFVCETSALEIEHSEEQHQTDVTATPKQKPELPESLTGVKRIMKTPKQKAEPVEDLRGKLLKTPKQKPEQQESLTGVKRIMKTPKLKSEPVEDLRGNLLKTPKLKPEQQECLSGVKRIMETPEKEALEDVKVELLKTPKAAGDADVTFEVVQEVETPANMEESEEPEQEECVTAAKTPQKDAEALGDGQVECLKTPKAEDPETPARLEESEEPEQEECVTAGKTPQKDAEALGDGEVQLLKTPKAAGDADVKEPETPARDCLTGVKRIMKTPRHKPEPVEDLRGKLLKTPKQKPEQKECLTGVKRIMETPEKEAEPLEDVKMELLKTPKAAGDAAVTLDVEELKTPAPESDKPEQQESLTGVKRIMKTPRHKSEPLEDLRGNLLKTPKQKPEQQECLTGVKRTMETPEKEAEPLEDVKMELLKTPEDADVQEETQAQVEEAVEKTSAMNTHMESPLDETEEPQELMEKEAIQVEDQTPPDCGLDVEKELDPACEDEQESEPATQMDDDPSDVPQVNVEKGDAVCAQLEASSAHDASDSSDKKETISQAAVEENLPEEPVKAEPAAVSEAVEMDAKKPSRGRKARTVDSEETEEATEQPEAPAVRGRRGKKTEATAPPAVKQSTRSRNAKSTENKDAELTLAESAPAPSKVAPKPKRGRNARKAADDQAETLQEVCTEAGMVQEAEKEQKPRRGRKTKVESAPEQQDVTSTPSEAAVKEADPEEVSSSQLESDENKSSEAVESVQEAPAAEMEPETVQKKPARGRRAKMAESKPAEDEQEPAEICEEAAEPVPVRGRRGKKTAAVKQTARGRNAKAQQSEDQPEPEKTAETEPVAEILPEVTPDQTPVNDGQEENETPPPEKESKPSRGRKTKQAPAEPPQPEQEKSEVVSEPVATKQRRTRKTNADAAEGEKAAEDVVVVAVETKPVRAKRGRNAKNEEEQVEKEEKSPSVDATETLEPVKKTRRTRKVEQDQVEPQEEIQTVETLVPQEVEAPVAAEPEKVMEQAKPRRGGRKTKQDAESESTESQEPPPVKPSRGRRGKAAAEEVDAEVPEEKPEQEVEPEKQQDVEPKTSRGRGAKTSAKSEVSQAVPAKRARRGAAPTHDEATAEPAAPESNPVPVEPAKKGRRAAAKPAAEEAKLPEDSGTEDAKTSKKSVQWKADVKVHDITPAKAVRGRKKKLQDGGDDTESSKKPEEKDLSEEVVASQPNKRARRGAKVTDEATVTPQTSADAEVETQPKTRRGRSAKK